MTVIQKFASAMRRLPGDRRGNVAIIAALAAIPMMVGIGGAVDLSSAYRARSAVQSAADAASLAAVAYTGTDEAVRKQDADLMFAQNAKGITVSNTALTLEGQNYVYSADYKTDNNFLRLIHIDSFAGSIKAAATTANSPIDVVLVLDSSGSMADQNRMTELKKAVSLFLSNFKTRDKTQVALVPFDSQVRADKTLFTTLGSTLVPNPYASSSCSLIQDPLDQAACLANQTVKPATIVCGNLLPVATSFDRSTCQAGKDPFKSGTSGTYPTSSNTRVSYSASNSGGNLNIVREGSLRYCFFSFFCNWYVTGTDLIYKATGSVATVPADTKPNGAETANNDLIALYDDNIWPKCFVDRSQEYDVRADPMVSTNKNTTYPQAKCANDSLQQVTPLTDDLNAMNTAVQKLQPAGNTNITIGLQWGMEAMTSAAPMIGARNDPTVRKVMIVLTDGNNTQNRWSGQGQSGEIDKRTLLACSSAKAMGMEIYTVRLIQGNGALLESCASKTDMYYSVSQAAELSSVFKELATSVKGVRLVF